ncbi:T9SS type A sorting domain-containing protein [Pontibacter sp. G13]|uniref:T9SS type A sorting domain-containing protein n=1 Tax=Pontibacter sp. G13 TaxID=3074898 RepID=UPI00288B7AE2|nr:T9SS type A sorting domain-containing protein [Pontibacter sp. G13]WNJ18519.1 T9SS type A sorting domain-containing protein [Pontibacter sp. G13]
MQIQLLLAGILLLGLLPLGKAQAQPDTISGIINSYTAITATDPLSNSITVSDASDFDLADQVLLIQMQGATISTTGSAYGTITSLNGAGTYEWASVCNVNTTNGEISFEYPLQNTYSPTSSSQLIRVPTYANAYVDGTLTAQPWDGATGGILAFSVNNTLELGADIDVSGQGFRGGIPDNGTSNCFFTTNSYALTNSTNGGQKGEGIAIPTSTNYARGPQANGGGGGNRHNSGGAGGSNYSAGGRGGDKDGSAFCSGNFPGVPGKTLASWGYSPANPYLFMGGGGGAGHEDNGQASNGGNGGGIIMIEAFQLIGNGFDIRANGADVVPMGNQSDGNSGGGAGGVIALQVDNIDPATNLTLSVNGGDGGSTNINCEGPGGGGSGGVVWTSNAVPGATTTQLSGGIRGVAAACANDPQGAISGTNGVSLTGYTIPTETTGESCVLDHIQIDLVGQALGSGIELNWEVHGLSDWNRIDIQRWHPSLREFQALSLEAAHLASHRAFDPSPLPASIYRVKLLDFEGRIFLSNTVEIHSMGRTSIQLFPNPVSKGEAVFMRGPWEADVACEWTIRDLAGRTVDMGNAFSSSGAVRIPLSEHVATGVYLVHLVLQGHSIQSNLIVR